MKEVKRVESQEIVVLDEGIDLEVMPHAAVCCWGALSALR